VNKRIKEKRRKQWWRCLNLSEKQVNNIYKKCWKLENERWKQQPIDHPFFHDQPERSKREDPHFNIQDFPDDVTADELKVFMLGMENKIVGCGALNSMET
jgi:hypothetical protein